MMQGMQRKQERDAPLRTSAVSNPEVSKSCQFREQKGELLELCLGFCFLGAHPTSSQRDNAAAGLGGRRRCADRFPT